MLRLSQVSTGTACGQMRFMREDYGLIQAAGPGSNKAVRVMIDRLRARRRIFGGVGIRRRGAGLERLLNRVRRCLRSSAFRSSR